VRFLVSGPQIGEPIFEAIAAVTTVESIAKYMKQVFIQYI